MNDRRASPDFEKEVRPLMERTVRAARDTLRAWTQKRGQSLRDYPAALVWCLKKPGKELREKAEMVLAWRLVQKELEEGNLGTRCRQPTFAARISPRRANVLGGRPKPANEGRLKTGQRR